VEEGGATAQEMDTFVLYPGEHKTGRVDLGVEQKGARNSPAKLAMKRRKVVEIAGPGTLEALSENRIKT
jgi:hypothetical protein